MILNFPTGALITTLFVKPGSRKSPSNSHKITIVNQMTVFLPVLFALVIDK